MNRPEAEKLLGGYAAGILTEAEKQVLFKAALEHQALFDALADEEALRELLADPLARQRLLAALSEPAKVQRFWRRPAVVGLAASLFLLATTTAVLRMREREPFPQAAREEAKDTLLLEQGVQQAPKVAEAPSPPAQGVAPERRSAKEAPRRVSVKGRGEMVPSEKEVSDATVRVKKAELPEEATQPGLKGDAEKSMYAGLGAAAPAPVTSEAMAADEQRASGLAVKSMARMPVLPPPVCQVRVEGDKIQLTVVSSPAGHLYVLDRSRAGVTVLSPLRTKKDQKGLTSTFEYGIDERAQVEVYVLSSAAPDPAALPAEGAVNGHRWKESPTE